MNGLARFSQLFVEGLLLGFTFAIGWIAALLLLGAVMV